MHKLTVSPSLELSLHNSIQFLPADRYQTAKRYEVMAAHLPTTESTQAELQSFGDRFALIEEKEAQREIAYNLELGKRLAADHFFPNRLQWAVLVASENEKPLTDYSEDALMDKLKGWLDAGLTPPMIEESLREIWKGITDDLARYFPARYGVNRQLNYLESYKRMLLCMLDHAIEDTPQSLIAYKESIRAVLDSQRPAKFSGPNPVTLEMERGWQRLQVYAAEGGCNDPRNLTVIEMYTWLENLEAKQEAQKRALRTGRK